MMVHTVIGAARMVMLTGEEPKDLWKKVASKGGTTVAAFNVLHRYGFERILERAVRAAAARSRELGRI
jgi:pyrroline-5-carboxylate reductase